MADELEDLVAIVGPLLGAMDALGFIGRYFHPPQFGQVLEAAGTPDEALAAARPRLDDWPERLEGVAACLKSACDHALAGFAALRGVADEPDGMRAVFRALGRLPRAQEALYPLAADLPPISRYFLEPISRDDEGLQARLTESGRPETAGVMHVANEPGARGGYSLYVPEYYAPDRAWPLVVAMHGGAGNGRSFLWSWLRDARAHGAILVAPTAVGDTWSLMGPDIDTPNLMRILDEVSGRWRIDTRRLLLTGMSDGGTFSYVSGLDHRSPFTHLAPISAAFHPMLPQMADGERLSGLPVAITHGALDWMFPFTMAREARDALAAAGAAVNYREIPDLSHTYPPEVNAELLAWLAAA
jgi:phospholipase/carboxylesterase